MIYTDILNKIWFLENKIYLPMLFIGRSNPFTTAIQQIASHQKESGQAVIKNIPRNDSLVLNCNSENHFRDYIL